MNTEKIELVEFPSIEDYAESLSVFRAEDYTNIQANEPPNNPYFYLLKCSQEDAAHYKTYARVLFQDAVGKGCDPQIIRKNLRSMGVHFFGKQLLESSEDEAGCVCIRRKGVLLKLKIEEEYLIQDGAVYENGAKGAQRICPHLILPIGIYKDMDKGTEQIQIAYELDGKWHSRIMPREKVYKASSLMDIAKYGIGVTSKTSGKLCEFLQSTEQLNRQILPLMRVSDHMGWNEDYTAFVPYTTGIHYTNEGSFFKEFQSVQRQKGTLEEWLALMKPIRNSEHIQERIAMAAAFASVLIKPSSSSPFMLDIWGGAGIGKTTILIAAASI